MTTEGQFKLKQNDWIEACKRVDTLEARCAWQAEMLERARPMVLTARTRAVLQKWIGDEKACDQWLADLEKGTQ